MPDVVDQRAAERLASHLALAAYASGWRRKSCNSPGPGVRMVLERNGLSLDISFVFTREATGVNDARP